PRPSKTPGMPPNPRLAPPFEVSTNAWSRMPSMPYEDLAAIELDEGARHNILRGNYLFGLHAWGSD
ncbi:MAG: hypothetical protein KDA59_25435, partial [Planctomycetales bacterium]|nr:hypothetical protein [Planctomycetales bacterium]